MAIVAKMNGHYLLMSGGDEIFVLQSQLIVSFDKNQKIPYHKSIPMTNQS